MRRASVDFKLLDHLATKDVAREHALDRVFDDELRLLGAHFGHRNVAFAAHPARIEHVALIAVLFATDADFLGVDDNYEITSICMRRIDDFMTATQYVGNFHGDATECLVGSVNHVPALGVVG